MTTVRMLFATLGVAGVVACGSSDGPSDEKGGDDESGGGHAGGSGVGGSGVDGEPLTLAPGEVVELGVAAGISGATVATPGGDERFVLIVASMQLDASGQEHGYELALDRAPPGAVAEPIVGCSLEPEAWQDVPLSNETPPSGDGPEVGAIKDITVPTPSGAETIPVQAIAVGERAVVWADISQAHPAVLEPEFVAEFLADFEGTILPRARSAFGVESDIDGDGRVSLVMSPATYETAVAFFSGCDLADSALCPVDNQGEYLYLTPPNTIAPPYDTPAAIKEILAHELAHMIHFNRKVLQNELPNWDESAYMIEGIGAFAQDALGYQAGNLYVTKAALDELDAFSLGETLADGVEYDTARDGALRGGSYLFVRWLYDRAGGDEAMSGGEIESRGGPALMRALLDAPTSVAGALAETTGASIEDLAADFWTSLAISNRSVETGVTQQNPCFSYLPTTVDTVTGRQRGVDLFGSIHGQPMSGPALQPLGATGGSLLAGGGELVELTAQPGQGSLRFTLSTDATTPVRVRLARVQ